MNTDEQLVLDMIGAWDNITDLDIESSLDVASFIGNHPTVRPEPVSSPRLRSLAPPLPARAQSIRPILFQPSAVVEVRKLFDTIPPPADYDDLKVASWVR